MTKTDPYAVRESSRFSVSRDGIEYFWADNYNECLIWLQRHVPYSWHHAFKYEGWRINDGNDQKAGNQKVA